MTGFLPSKKEATSLELGQKTNPVLMDQALIPYFWVRTTNEPQEDIQRNPFYLLKRSASYTVLAKLEPEGAASNVPFSKGMDEEAIKDMRSAMHLYLDQTDIVGNQASTLLGDIGEASGAADLGLSKNFLAPIFKKGAQETESNVQGKDVLQLHYQYELTALSAQGDPIEESLGQWDAAGDVSER